MLSCTAFLIPASVSVLAHTMCSGISDWVAEDQEFSWEVSSGLETPHRQMPPDCPSLTPPFLPQELLPHQGAEDGDHRTDERVHSAFPEGRDTLCLRTSIFYDVPATCQGHSRSLRSFSFRGRQMIKV